MRAHVVQICERNGIEINYGDTQVQMASSARFGFARLDRPAHMRLWGGDVVLIAGSLAAIRPA